MPSRGLVGCQPLDPHRRRGPWRPLSRLGSERVGWVGESLLFIPPTSPSRGFISAPCLGCFPCSQPCSIPPFQETLCPTLPPSTWSHQFMGCPVPPAEVCALPALPGGDCQRCLARLGGLKSLCFKSILSGEKKTTCQSGCRQIGLKVQDRGKFSMTEVCSWPKGREEAIMVGVDEITAGRSIKQRKKLVVS